jgi:hypothetical protein
MKKSSPRWLENFCEQIVVRCVVHDDVGVVEVLHDAVEDDNGRVSGCDLVQTGKGKIQNSGKKEVRRTLYQITRPDLHHLDPLDPRPPKFILIHPEKTGLSPKARRAAVENMALANLILSNIPVYTSLTKLATQSGR